MQNNLLPTLMQFFADYPVRHYTKGQLLIWNNEDPAGIFFLEKGSVGQYDIARNGQKNTLNIFKPSAFFPMSWALNKTPNEYFYEALEAADCRIAPAEDVVQFLQANPVLALDLLTRVYRGTDGLLRRLNERMAGSARTQLMLELTIGVYRFGEQTEKGVALHVKTTELAAQTGLSRETVSRELKKLADTSLISLTRGVVEILDLKRLEDELRTS